MELVKDMMREIAVDLVQEYYILTEQNKIDWHKYAINWNFGEFTWYFDGEPYYTATKHEFRKC